MLNAATKPEIAAPPDPIAEMIYLLGHDLRASIRAIVEIPSWLEEELEDRPEGLPEQVGQYLRLLRQHGTKLDKMVQVFSAYASIGAMDDDPASCPAEIVADCVREIGFPAHWTISLEVNVSELPLRRSDAVLLFSALFANAKDHADHKAAKLDVRVDAVGDRVRVAVADTGPGIATAECENALKPLVKLGPATDIDRVGMGLAIVLRIVEKYRGRLHLRSGKDKIGLWVELGFPA